MMGWVGNQAKMFYPQVGYHSLIKNQIFAQYLILCAVQAGRSVGEVTPDPFLGFSWVIGASLNIVDSS
jgi:hypothetical protein